MAFIENSEYRGYGWTGVDEDYPVSIQAVLGITAETGALVTQGRIRELKPYKMLGRPTGRWILHENQCQEDIDNGNYLYICSECGKTDLHAKTQEVPFCWWCGANMEAEHD